MKGNYFLKGDMHKMKKSIRKVLSLILALAMILTLAPLAVFAEDDPVPADPVVVEEPAEEPAPETGSVVAVVWNQATEELLDSLADSTGKKLFSTGILRDNALASGVPILGDLSSAGTSAEVPEFNLVLISDNGDEYYLGIDDTAKGSEIVTETVTKYDRTPADSAADLNKIHASRYTVYKADNLPVGHYTIAVKDVPEPFGFIYESLKNSDVEVVANETVMIGETKTVSGFSEKQRLVIYWDKTYKDLDFTGLFLHFRKETLGFKFRTTDVAGDPVKGAEFVMVNRDELLGLLEPVIGAGKAVFTKAIENLGNPEVFSFEELVKLHTSLLKQNEQGYITLDMESAFGIVQAYLALLSGSGPEVLAQFINYDEAGNFAGLKHPIPAVLKATSDENGIVTFTESSNITLTWLIQILLDFGVGTLNTLAVGNPLLGFITPLLQMIQLVMDPDSVDVDSLNSDTCIELVRNIPGISDNSTMNTILNGASWAGGLIDGLLTAEVKRGIVNWIHNNLYDPIMDYVYGMLQNYGIVGDKISKGNYFLFEYKTPDAVLDEEGNVVEDYSRNPLVYTVNIDWKEPDNIYASVTDLGLIGPYIAPQFYDFVRNTQYEGVVAKYFGKKAWDYDFLSKLMTGRIQLAEKEKQQVEGAFTAFMAYSLYDALGLDLLFNTRTALMLGMNDYLISKKDTAVNLRNYVNKQAKNAKSVYAGTLTPLSSDVAAEDLWTFYTLDASPTLTATKLIDKSTKDIAAAFPEGSERQKGILQNGSTVSAVVSRIGNSVEGVVKSVADRIKAAIGDTVQKAVSAVTDQVKNMISGLLGNLFNNGSSTPSNAGA